MRKVAFVRWELPAELNACRRLRLDQPCRFAGDRDPIHCRVQQWHEFCQCSQWNVSLDVGCQISHVPVALLTTLNYVNQVVPLADCQCN
jgi:hypothetical protein